MAPVTERVKNQSGTFGFADWQFFLLMLSWEVLFLLEKDHCPIPI